MFILGFILSWFILGLFVYSRDNKGYISIWGTGWDVIIIILPAIPIIYLYEFIQEKRKGE